MRMEGGKGTKSTGEEAGSHPGDHVTSCGSYHCAQLMCVNKSGNWQVGTMHRQLGQEDKSPTKS